MPIILCPICNKRMVTEKVLAGHLAKTHPEEPKMETSVETPVVAPVAETPVVSEKITLRFSAPIEVSINSVHYFGTVIEAPNMAIATEIVRIAKEAYGRGILLN